LKWEYRPHQIEGGLKALDKLRKHSLAYLAWEERTGKTGTAIYAFEQSKLNSCLIVTKKKAIEGWVSALQNFPTSKKYFVINYESLHKVEGNYDMVIIDEAHHAISGYPKVSAAWKKLYPLSKNKPILYLSATPYAENLGLIYHQLKLSAWSPLKFLNFYAFHKAYGIPDVVYTPTPRETYKRYRDDLILDKIIYLFDFKTRSEVGIVHEPGINLIKIELSEHQKKVIKIWVKDKVIKLDDVEIPNDSPGKARSVHYQIEGGTVKLEEGSYTFDEQPKIDYIVNNPAYKGAKMAVMAHFIAERALLAKMLPGVNILSSDGDAEGVDLSMYDKLIIYSMSDKTSKYTQRLARQANHKRKTPIVVDILVCNKPAIGQAIYEAVALKKTNFVKNSYDLALKDYMN